MKASRWIAGLLVVVLTLAAPLAAAQPAPNGNPFEGDLYSFEHQLGFFNAETGMGQCSAPHTSGTNDNTVTFDGQTEPLDPYTDGTMPFVSEIDIMDPTSEGVSSFTIESFASGGGGDLFPEGFEDPETGTPLDVACIEIGIDDTLDGDPPQTVINSEIDFFDDMDQSLFGGPITITSFFGDPWNGGLSLGLSGFTGQNIRRVQLLIETAPDATIFTDGFESGDTSAWTDEAAPDATYKALGSLDVTPEAALNGTSFGLEVNIDTPDPAVLTDASPDDDYHYRATFMLDPNGVNLAEGEQVAIFAGRNEAGTLLFRVWLRRSSGEYTLFTEAIDNEGTQVTSFEKIIDDAPQQVAVVWKAGLDEDRLGLMKIFTNGDQLNSAFLVDLDAAGQRLSSVEFGLVDGQGISGASSGTFFLDEFTSHGPSGNNAPAASTIIIPRSDSTLALAGNPNDPFTVEWSEAVDVDGDAVDYVYQMASDSMFAQIIFFDDILAAENTTAFFSTIGALATLLDNAGITTFPTTIFHRVTSTDGMLSTVGPTARLNVERGMITAVEGEAGVPATFALHDNYPNPFNPETTIAFDVKEPVRVVLAVYDGLGRRIATLVDRRLHAGRYHVPFEAAGLSSGVYLYRVQLGDFSAVKTMILLK